MSESPPKENQLLFGLLALQNGLISREQLVAAFGKWTSDKSVPLDEVLIADGAIGQAVCDTLKQLVQLHLDQHGGEVDKSLAALPAGDLMSACEQLGTIGDTDVQRTLITIPHANGDAAASTVGASTSEGGRFRVIRPLPNARGGMGVISIAQDTELGRKVALKQIIDEKADNEAYRKKFQVEAEVTGNLEHPGVVPVYGLGTDPEGRPYYAMRLILGDDLQKEIDKFHGTRNLGPLQASSADVNYGSVAFHALIDRLIDVAQAVSYAHSRGVLHRDLKPGNILVGEYGETLVIDWGLARLPVAGEDTSAEPLDTISEFSEGSAPLQVRSGSNVDATVQGQALGTVGYAPPEQLDGRVNLISERSDVYGLGAILYHILTGRSTLGKIDRDNLTGKMRDTIEGKITPPIQVKRSIPKPLSGICMRALATEPSERYDSVQAFITELERWKADQPVEAVPDAILDRLLRLTRRYRAAALATGAALLGIAVIAAGALVFVNRARVREADAREHAEVLADRNQAVVDSFVNAFRSADPANEGVTTNTTALQVLEQAVDSIEEGELQDDPLARATLLNALGLSIRGLGGTDRALAAFESSVEVHKTELGLRHPDTIAAMASLAIAYLQVGRFDEGFAISEEVVKLSKAEFGLVHETTSRALNAAGFASDQVGKPDKAMEYYRQEYEVAHQLYAADHPSTLTAANNLAFAYHKLGRRDEAIPLYEKTLPLLKRVNGVDHPITLICTANLAMAYHQEQRTSEAIPLLEEVLAVETKKLGRSHPDTMVSIDNLAWLYIADERVERAVAIAEEVLTLRKEHLGEEHPDTLASMSRLAEAFKAAGRLDEALALAEASVTKRTSLIGEDHPDTLVGMHLLGAIYQEMGQLEQAVGIYERTVELRTKKLGADHPATQQVVDELAALKELTE